MEMLQNKSRALSRVYYIIVASVGILGDSLELTSSHAGKDSLIYRITALSQCQFGLAVQNSKHFNVVIPQV